MVDGKRPEKGLFLWNSGWLGAVALKMSGASADWVQLHQEIFFGNMRVEPVWNLLGETEDSFLTFYAKK